MRTAYVKEPMLVIFDGRYADYIENVVPAVCRVCGDLDISLHCVPTKDKGKVHSLMLESEEDTCILHHTKEVAEIQYLLDTYSENTIRIGEEDNLEIYIARFLQIVASNILYAQSKIAKGK